MAGEIFGMSPDLFSVLAGGAGAAIAGPDTWQGRLGQVAAKAGQSGIQDTAGQAQRKETLDLLKSVLGGTSGTPSANPQSSTPATPGQSNWMEELYPALQGMNIPKPTPVGMEGPDAVNFKITSDGITTNTKSPMPTAQPVSSPMGGGQQADPFSLAVLSALSDLGDRPSLRGLSPEQILATDKQGMSGVGAGLEVLKNQQANVVDTSKAVGANTSAQAALIKAIAKNKEEDNKSSKLTRGSTFIADGKVQREVSDAQGNLIRTEVLGDATEGFRYFESPEGDIKPFKVGETPPSGFRAVTARNVDMTPQLKSKIKDSNANIRNALVQGVDGKGNDLTEQQMKVYNDLYNDNLRQVGEDGPRYIVIPEVKGSWGMGGKKSRTVELPYSSKQKRFVTQEDVLSIAKHQKIPVEEVLKKLGVE